MNLQQLLFLFTLNNLIFLWLCITDSLSSLMIFTIALNASLIFFLQLLRKIMLDTLWRLALLLLLLPDADGPFRIYCPILES